MIYLDPEQFSKYHAFHIAADFGCHLKKMGNGDFMITQNQARHPRARYSTDLKPLDKVMINEKTT